MIAASKTRRLSTKGRGVGRKRAEPDTSKYSGRIAARIRLLREKAGKSIDEFAVAVKRTTTTVYRWESGQREIEFDSLPAIAAALGVNVRLLFPQE